ncbi:MAG: peptidoglycan-binding domain-containing protein [Luteolibacter sp.]
MKPFIAIAFATLFTLSSSNVAEAQSRYGYGHGHGYRDSGHDRHRLNRVEARAQQRLRQLGYYRGRIDGSFGPQSRRALVRFQRDHRLPMSGRLDYRTLRALRIR